MNTMNHFVEYCRNAMNGTQVKPFLLVEVSGLFSRPDELIIGMTMTVRGQFSQSFHCTLAECIKYFQDIDPTGADKLEKMMVKLPDQETQEDVNRIALDLQKMISRKCMSIFKVQFQNDCNSTS